MELYKYHNRFECIVFHVAATVSSLVQERDQPASLLSQDAILTCMFAACSKRWASQLSLLVWEGHLGKEEMRGRHSKSIRLSSKVV